MKLRSIGAFAAAVLVGSAVVIGSNQVRAGDGVAASMTMKVLDDHLADFGKGDLDAIVANYTSDAVIMVPGAVFKGHDKIRGMFTGLIKEFGAKDVKFKMVTKEAHGPMAIIIWEAETGKAKYDMGTDTFIMRDGKIALQTVVVQAKKK